MNETMTADRKAQVAERQKRIGAAARRLARQKGEDWKTLSRDTRQALRHRAREGLKTRVKRAGSFNEIARV